MTYDRKAIWLCLGLVVSAIGGAGSASAQYNRGYDRDPDYDRRNGYERRDRNDRRDGYRRDDRGGPDQGRRGYDQGPSARPGPGRGNSNPLAGMSLEDQKRAIKNQREAQKKLIKRGIVPQ
jgi:hypothetical protein